VNSHHVDHAKACLRVLNSGILLQEPWRPLNFQIGIILIHSSLKLFWKSLLAYAINFTLRWEFLSCSYFWFDIISVTNAKRYAATAGWKIADHKHILMLLSSNDIVGLCCLLAAALWRGASALTICGLLDRAISGLYSSRSGFTKRDLDIALLVKSIGGPRLLYALQKSQGFASWRTVGRHYKIPRLLPSIGIPSVDEISSNIASFFDLSVKPQPTPLQNGLHPGNIIMVDGVALETRCHYCPKHDSILGLCCEYSCNVDTKVTSLDSVEKCKICT